MLVRLIIFIALVSLAVIIYRKFVAAKSTPPPLATPTMRKCSHCGIHLPDAEALEHNQQYFCSQEHQQAFLDNDRDD